MIFGLPLAHVARLPPLAGRCSASGPSGRREPPRDPAELDSLSNTNPSGKGRRPADQYDRGATGKKWKHFAISRIANHSLLRIWSMSMVDTVTLRTAVETAWSIFCATHHGVDAGDSRCLLEGHQQGRCEARGEGGGRARKLRPRLSLAVFRRRMLRPLARLTERTAPAACAPSGHFFRCLT